jgi:glycosyltransferase involved in cell wall biosynthesis
VTAPPDGDTAAQLAGHAIVHFHLQGEWLAPSHPYCVIPRVLAPFAAALCVGPATHVRDMLTRPPLPEGHLCGSPDVHFWTPPRWLPRQDRFAGLEQGMERARLRHLARWLRHRRLRPICYAFSVLDPSLIRRCLPGAPLVYHMYDDYLAYEDVPADLPQQEDGLLRNADLVIACTEALAERKRPVRPDIAVVANGVDCDRFAHPDPKTHVDLSRFPTPRIGYVGWVNQKVDLETLETIAGAYPDATILLVGDATVVQRDASPQWIALTRRPNVTVLPPVHPNEVPSVLAQLDVGIAPYDTGTWLQVGSPLKVYEYLAAGLPVVVTDTLGIQSLKDVVTTARTAEDWIAGVRQALTAGDRCSRKRRQEQARQHDWSNRGRVIAEHLATLVRPATRPRPS